MRIPRSNIILNLYLLLCLSLINLSCGTSSQNSSANNGTTNDTCNSPDAHINCSFLGIPKELTNTVQIARDNEQGEKLIISGTIYQPDGKTPQPDVIMYAYHTDSKGYYSKSGKETGVQKWHGQFHGWGKTDANGHFEIRTIRPARYPDNSMPAHIHAALKTGEQSFWISDFVFSDDSLVNDKYLQSLPEIGGTGVVELRKNAAGEWIGQRMALATQLPNRENPPDLHSYKGVLKLDKT